MAVNSRLGITHLERYVISACGGNLPVSISSAMAPAGSLLIYQFVRLLVMQPLTPLPSLGQRLARLGSQLVPWHSAVAMRRGAEHQ